MKKSVILKVIMILGLIAILICCSSDNKEIKEV